jgi:5'-nucleotidase
MTESSPASAVARLRARRLRLLITNDDGIHAPGFAVLERIAAALSDDVWLVAPEAEQSGASHSLTLHMPLRMRRVSLRKFAVLGTPTDCVMLGAKHIIPKYGAEEGDARAPDLVLSGVNRGSNVADDITYSGTIAGAMEGCTLGLASIALSQAYGFKREEVSWATAEQHAPPLIARLLDAGWPSDVLLNVNFPDAAPDEIAEIAVTIQGRRDSHMAMIVAREDTRGVPYYWIGFERKRSNPPKGTDLRAIYDGLISVTPLHLNLTHADTMPDLARAVASLPQRSAEEG